MANSGNNISLSKERLKGFEVDLNHLIDDFVLQVVDGAPLTYSTFKAMWKQRHMSFVIATPPSIRSVQNHVQSIFMAVLDRFDHPSPLSNREDVPNGLKTQPVRVDLSIQDTVPDPPDLLPIPSDDDALDDWLQSNKPQDVSLDDFLVECEVDNGVSPIDADNPLADLQELDNTDMQNRQETMHMPQGPQEAEIEAAKLRWRHAFPASHHLGVLSYLEALGQIIVPIPEETEGSEPVKVQPSHENANDPQPIEEILGYDDDRVNHPPDWDADIELAGVPRYLGVPHFQRDLRLWVPFEAKVAALYAVYTCYKIQIYEPKVYIHVPYPILCELVSILPELQFRGIWDAIEILKVLMQENAFVFGSYRRVPSLEGVSLEAEASEVEVGRELAFHLRTTLKGACNHSGLQLHCKRYSTSRGLLTKMGKWAAGLIGEQNSVEAIFDCSVGDRLASTIREQHSLIHECMADDDVRYVRRSIATIIGQYKNNLDSLDESGQSKPHKLDSEAGQPVQHLKRKWKQKLMPQDKRVIPGRASKKRGGGNTKMLAGKLRAKRLRKNMTESEVEEMEMLKGIPRAARDAVLRSLERQKAGTGTQPYENQ